MVDQESATGMLTEVAGIRSGGAMEQKHPNEQARKTNRFGWSVEILKFQE
jgi:hypothetical protein